MLFIDVRNSDKQFLQIMSVKPVKSDEIEKGTFSPFYFLNYFSNSPSLIVESGKIQAAVNEKKVFFLLKKYLEDCFLTFFF